MSTHKLKLLAVLICSLYLSSTSINAQEFVKMRQRKSVTIDSIQNLRIDKAIFYRDPIGMEFSTLTDTTYIPQWYDAFCAFCNVDHFKNYPSDALKYYHSQAGMTETMLRDFYNQVVQAGGTRKYQSKSPYEYIFGELQMTLVKSGEKIVLIFGTDSNVEFKNLRFNQPTKKNINKEKTDSINHPSTSVIAFMEEDGILKVPDQMHVINDLISNGGQYLIGGDLAAIKDIMYRANIYIQSEIENGKRIFKTMKKGNNGHQKVKESDKP